MKRERIVPIAIIGVVVLVGAAVGIYFAVNPAAWRQALADLDLAEPEAGGLMASGFIEAEEITIAPELGGRVVELLADEGDQVEAGQVLVRLDTTLLDAQIEAAQAGLDVAQAGLAQALAGARPEQIRQAEAALAQAEAARDGVYQVWQDAIAIRDNPQELDGQIAQAKAQVAAAEGRAGPGRRHERRGRDRLRRVRGGVGRAGRITGKVGADSRALSPLYAGNAVGIPPHPQRLLESLGGSQHGPGRAGRGASGVEQPVRDTEQSPGA